jgi:hypothetical protein
MAFSWQAKSTYKDHGGERMRDECKSRDRDRQEIEGEGRERERAESVRASERTGGHVNIKLCGL